MSSSTPSPFFRHMDENNILDRCFTVLEEHNVWLDPDTTQLKHIVYVSDKIAKNRQIAAQKNQMNKPRRK